MPETAVHQYRDITPSGRVTHAYKMADIDALEGGRDNLILVQTPNNKKLGSKARRNYGLYGEVGKPTVSVSEFIASYPEEDGGAVRARLSLLWDLNHKHVRIIDRKSVRK